MLNGATAYSIVLFERHCLRFLIGFGIDISYRQLLCVAVLVRYECCDMYQNLSTPLVF